jgi:hypothetical protein
MSICLKTKEKSFCFVTSQIHIAGQIIDSKNHKHFRHSAGEERNQ